ncbi:MAG: hypothetical protein WBA52_00205 [Dolichospermum sp.]
MVSISYLNKHFNSEKIAMLKIRTLILVLSLTPLLSLNWQLPSQAQKSPSVGTAGGQSGGGTTGGSGTTNSNPSVGTAGGQSGGGTTGGSGTTNSNPSVGTAGGQSGGGTTGSGTNNQNNQQINTGLSAISESPNITVTTGENGFVTLNIASPTQERLNAAFTAQINNLSSSNPKLAIAILLNSDGQQAAQAVAKQIAKILIEAGVSEQSAEALTNALAQLNTSGSVDINKLSIAINAYNNIVRQSSPETLQTLSQNEDFLKTRSILTTLRKSID